MNTSVINRQGEKEITLVSKLHTNIVKCSVTGPIIALPLYFMWHTNQASSIFLMHCFHSNNCRSPFHTRRALSSCVAVRWQCH